MSKTRLTCGQEGRGLASLQNPIRRRGATRIKDEMGEWWFAGGCSSGCERNSGE